MFGAALTAAGGSLKDRVEYKYALAFLRTETGSCNQNMWRFTPLSDVLQSSLTPCASIVFQCHSFPLTINR